MMQKNLEGVVETFKNNSKNLLEDYKIKLIYIFGSYAKGTNNSNSDLDIAVLLEHNYNAMDKLSLISDLTLIFKRDDIDLVILNSANSVLRHQIVKYGKIIFMENEDIKVNFEVRTLKEYMDMEPFRKTQMKYIDKWIKKFTGVEE
ncbi:nucleotidyltransferase [Clostridium novyi A str. 4552]|uniref:Nucleotidyltransferase n=1 Tax=Clostridium novyi A str. 4552 TaxID=1444289 RepID=A0A0A0IFP3_CLONO|nr:nucleotidyltransferase domain-containing protein [Clostridium novyi]KGM98410.1 nucleotidyltransferase [Clostridium novyi A str. 4552]